MALFNAKDFYPTPPEVINLMMEGEQVSGLVWLEPNGGKGDIVDYLTDNGAKNIIACEINEDLKKILQTKCNVIESDFLNLTSDRISHVDAIVMNPPFSADEQHIIHAYEIAPAGCRIIALCNYTTISNPHTSNRKKLATLIENFGTCENLGDCFTDAERKTGVEIGLIKLQKQGTSQRLEFEGFFMDEDPEEEQANGLISYNVIRDVVNRYIQACKVYRELLTVKQRLNDTTGSFFSADIGLTVQLDYENYKKALQKAGWLHVIDKNNLTKYTTKGVREDVNKFVEQQTQIPFTMRNIYHMLDIIRQTAGQRMDKAIVEVFDRVTERHHENRHNVKGWKTNLHFLVGKKFILDWQINPAKEYGYTSDTYNSMKNAYDGIISDLEKALCFVEGEKYFSEEYENGKWVKSGINTVNHSINRNNYGEWYDSHFFRYKGYKNGNMHFEFKNEDVWGRFNQRVAKIKGYPLFEYQKQTAYQKRNAGASKQAKGTTAQHQDKEAKQARVLFEI